MIKKNNNKNIIKIFDFKNYELVFILLIKILIFL